MPSFSELIVKDELTKKDQEDLQRIASEIERFVYDLADTIGTTGATFSHRSTFQRALNVFTTGMAFGKASKGLVFHNAKAGAHRLFMGVIDGTDGEFRMVLDDDLATANTADTFSIRRDPADPDNVGQYNFSIQGGETGATKVTIGGEVEIWAGDYAASQGKTTVFNEGGKDIDFRVESDTVADAFKIDAGNNLLQIGVAVEYEIETVTGTSDTLDHTNHMVLCDCSSNAITINLPAVSGATGRVYHIKKIDSTANAVTVDGASSETIDDGTTATISTQYESITIICDGSEWWII